jgi:hypothetical protein
MTRRFSLLVLAITMALSGWLLSQPRANGATSDREPGSTEANVDPLTNSWERAIPFQETPDGLSTIRASECGECHVAIYEEWSTTAHALALQDPQFQAEWKKDDHLWLCINCHTPLENQQERVVSGLVGGDFRKPVTHQNDRFDLTLRDEGITCAVCHVRDGSILGPGPGGDAPHPVTRGGDVLSQRLCESCHNVQGRLSDVLICTFTTGDEWRASAMADEGKGCIDCHMPPVSRPMAEGEGARHGRKHTWTGAGIAKLPELVKPLREDYSSGYDIEVQARRVSTSGGEEKVLIDAAITNARAGHELPTGDPERFITFEVILRDRGGTSVWSRTERIGEVWEWAPVAKQVSDNSLKPGERREFRYAAPLAGNALVPLAVEIVARNHRMTEENARAMGVYGSYPLAVETVRQSAAVTEPQ